ncbi:MAG: flagellar hook-associated protein FlgK [Nitrospinae bacterium]|nr:flagellar hook-associated protein FlgK [Nitrospinota bacterium]
MTTNIFSVMNTAKLGLLAQQLAIETTGQNVANVQTQGYSRQDVSFEAAPPRAVGTAILGTGVMVSSIARAHDSFLFSETLGEETSSGNSAVRKGIFDQLDALFSESSDGSLSQSLQNFFGSLQDLSLNPSGLPERATLISRAESLASAFKKMGDRLFQSQLNVDQTVITKVSEINQLTANIAQLNKTIHGSEANGATANDLRDQRDKLVRELAGKVDITVVSETNGQVNLTLQNGKALVLGNTAFSLSTSLNGNNLGFRDIRLDDGSGNTSNITSVIKDGELRGYLDMRDTELAGLRDQIDRLAAGLAREVNRVHQSGMGLDGITGRNFFAALSATARANTQNTGSGNVSMTNASAATASLDKYEMTFASASSFTLKNLTTGLASGTFTFTAGSAFNLAGGLAVTITGSAAAGDKFTFSLSENAATTLSVASAIKADSNKIAAGKSTPNDGQNALDLAALQRTLIFDGTTLTQAGSGTFTFEEFYSSVVGNVGIKASESRNSVDQQQAILTQLDNRRESVAGVSIDEEMINIVKFQQAFNASARVLNVVNALFDTLQNRI